jgi:hypothetical protein
MQRRHFARSACVRIGARVEEVLDDFTLACWIPVRTPRFSDYGCVERFCTATVTGAYVSPERDELPGGVGVVGECRNVQCGVARVQLSVTFGGRSTRRRGPTER